MKLCGMKPERIRADSDRNCRYLLSVCHKQSIRAAVFCCSGLNEQLYDGEEHRCRRKWTPSTGMTSGWRFHSRFGLMDRNHRVWDCNYQLLSHSISCEDVRWDRRGCETQRSWPHFIYLGETLNYHLSMFVILSASIFMFLFKYSDVGHTLRYGHLS